MASKRLSTTVIKDLCLQLRLYYSNRELWLDVSDPHPTLTSIFSDDVCHLQQQLKQYIDQVIQLTDIQVSIIRTKSKQLDDCRLKEKIEIIEGLIDWFRSIIIWYQFHSIQPE